MGISFGEVGSVGFILAQKLGWNDDKTAVVKIGYISSIGIIGIAFGCVMGSSLT